MPSTLYAEEHLVRDILAGHALAFTTLHNRYAPLLTSVLLRVIKDREHVNDLLQDTFLRVWTNLHRYDPAQGRLTSWLSTIARNVALDELKGRQVRLLATNRLAAYADEPCFTRISEGIPHQALMNYLSPKYRKVIELVFYCDYTRQEIADTLGLPLGTVKTQYRMAMQQLRQVLHHDIRQY